MPRRNLYLILVVCLVSALCYRKADSAHRSRYGKMFDAFVQILELVEEDFVESVDDRALFEGALHGMVNQLDEHSRYFNPDASERQKQSLDQEFGGIGIEVAFDREVGALRVVMPLVGSPAFNAGMLPGDIIVGVDGDDVNELDTFDAFEKVVRRLRGKPGETVRLKVLHEGQEQPVEIVVTRDRIQVDAVLGDHRREDGQWDFLVPQHLLPGQQRVAYIRIHSFGRQTRKKLEETIQELDPKKLDGLILDLRNNGGGLLDEAVDICNLFVSAGRIVTVKGRDGKLFAQHDADNVTPFANLPLAVLINGESASASEIVAACLQDHQRATIVGERSYGKGTVQEIRPLVGEQGALKLTIATYWRPSDHNIHRARKATEKDRWGVIPDEGFHVPLVAAQRRELAVARRARDLWKPAGSKPVEKVEPEKEWPAVDPQFLKALEAIQQRKQAPSLARQL